MRRAIAATGDTRSCRLMDGSVNRGFDIRSEAVAGGDAKSPSIAAASILAKVTRDRIMAELDGKIIPNTALQSTKGYPTRRTSLRGIRIRPMPRAQKIVSLFSRKDRARLEAKLAEKKTAEG